MAPPTTLATPKPQQRKNRALGLFIVLMGWPAVAAIVGGVSWLCKHWPLF